MANPTSNFGWQMPTNTDLVKDLPADFEVFGQAVDTSLMDLKGGTTGQVLSKASNTDMDFTWVTSDDANAIQNAIVDAKGDLISATGNDVPARLAVGNNGETLVADSSASTGLRWQGNYSAGKNAIINGDFRINQRAFTSITTTAQYGFDRWALGNAGNFGTVTYTPQNFTLGSAPVAGYEGTTFARITTTGQTQTGVRTALRQPIESVRTFANSTVTVSFWAKAASGTPKIAVNLEQQFGTGGSPSANVDNYLGQATLSTSWARYSVTGSIASISGKTVGTNNNDLLMLHLVVSAGSDFNSSTGSLGIQSNTFDFWGVQVEQGSTATAFQTATGTLAGELAACQRYYYRYTSGAAGERFGTGYNTSTTQAFIFIPFPVQMRVKPTALEQSGTAADYTILTNTTATCSVVPVFQIATLTNSTIVLEAASGLTAGYGAFGRVANTSAYLGWSAEL